MRLAAAALVLYAAFTAIAAYSVYASASDIITVNVTNGTAYVQFGNMTLFNFSTTQVRVGYVNVTHIAVTYTCQYQYSIDECYRINVTIYNATTPVYTTNFTDLTQLESIKGLVAGVAYFNVTGFPYIVVEVHNIDLNETKSITLPGPPKTAYTGFMSLLSTLIPIAIAVSLAAKGSPKAAGAGLIAFGVVVLALPYMGIAPPNQLLLMTLAFLLGFAMIWLGGGSR